MDAVNAIAGWHALSPGTTASLAARTRHPLALAVGVVLLVLPFGDVEVPVAGVSLVHLAMVVPTLLALWMLVRDEVAFPPSMILVGLGLGAVGGLISSAGGVNGEGAVQAVVISFVTLGYAIGVALAHRPGLERIGPELFVVVGGVVAAMALTSAGSIEAAEGGWVVNGRLTGPFSQPNELGIFCAALLPVAVACLVTTRSRRRLAVLGLATACLVAAWALSMSRGAWIGGIAALVCLAVGEPRTRRMLLGVGSAIVATCVVAVMVPANTALLGVIGARIRSLGDPGQNQYDDRPLIWAEAWRQATEHPWLGVGPGGYSLAATDSSSAVSSYGADHPHDLFLTILAERGMVGITIGVIVVAGCVLAARAHLLGTTPFGETVATLRTRSVAVIAALVAVSVHCVFDMPLRNPIVSGLVWTLLGMAIVAETTRPRPRSRAGGPGVRPSTLPPPTGRAGMSTTW